MSVPEPVDPTLDASAWTELVECYDQAVLLVLIESWMSDPLKEQLSAEDILQEAWAQAWRDREQHEWRGRRAFRAWLLQIAKNRIRDAAERLGRKKRGGSAVTRRFSALEGSTHPSISVLLPGLSETPSRIAHQHERAVAIREALNQLADEERAIIELRFLEQLPMTEVAKRLGIKRTTAHDRLWRGLRRYQTELETRMSSSCWRQ